MPPPSFLSGIAAATVVESWFGLRQDLLRLVVVEHDIEPGTFQILELPPLRARHFTEAEIGEVAALVNQLFERNWTEKTGSAQSGSTTAPRGLTPAQRRRLH